MAYDQEVWTYLKGQGFTDAGAAGCLGNIQAESGVESAIAETSYMKKMGITSAQYLAQVDNGSYSRDKFIHDSIGVGLVGFTYWTLKGVLYDTAKQQGKSVGDLYVQLDALMTCLSSYSKAVLNTMKTTDSVRTASDTFLLQFERPASVLNPSTKQQTCDKRYSYSQTFYNKFAGKGVVTSGMKYSDSNPPMVCMQTQSDCYKGTYKMTIRGILIHDTGCNNPWISRYVQPSDNDPNKAQLLKLLGKNLYGNDWNHIHRSAGLNAWVGKLTDGTVTSVQTMPWNYAPWGCGGGSKGSCNDGWIQWEMCLDDYSSTTYFNACIEETCQLAAYLCKKYNLNPLGTVKYKGINVPVILCHWDSYNYKLGAGHYDIYDWINKHNMTMQYIRERINEIMQEDVKPRPEVIVDYQCKVTAGAGLNCRRTPVNGVIVKTYPVNTVLHITKESEGWGYTGEGWVSLTYVKKIEEDDEMLTYEQFKEYMQRYEYELKAKDASNWSTGDLQWAVESGLMQGAGSTDNLMPLDHMTREQAAALLHRYHTKFNS